jgi:hypothetical protein
MSLNDFQWQWDVTEILNKSQIPNQNACFELGGEQNEDPVAKLLLESSKSNAAKGIQAHFNLNKLGVHFLSGEPYVKLMGGVDEYSIIEALRIVELFLMLQTQLDKAIFSYGLALWENKYHEKCPYGKRTTK